MTDTDELYGELSRLTAMVNVMLAVTDLHVIDNTARMPLGEFAEIERGARRATAVIAKHALR